MSENTRIFLCALLMVSMLLCAWYFISLEYRISYLEGYLGIK